MKMIVIFYHERHEFKKIHDLIILTFVIPPYDLRIWWMENRDTITHQCTNILKCQANTSFLSFFVKDAEKRRGKNKYLRCSLVNSPNLAMIISELFHVFSRFVSCLLPRSNSHFTQTGVCFIVLKKSYLRFLTCEKSNSKIKIQRREK